MNRLPTGLARLAVSCLFASAMQVAPPAQFRSSVDVVLIEAQVVDRNGVPATGLQPKDFEVTINGSRRAVISADFISASTRARVTGAATTPLPTSVPTTSTEPGRAFVIAIHEGSFSPAAMQRTKPEVRRFIEKLEPEDRVGVYLYPCGKASLELTRDRSAVNRVIDHAAGCFEPPAGRSYISPTEIIDIAANNREVLDRVARRECGGGAPAFDRGFPTSPGADECTRVIANQARGNASSYEQLAARDINGLTALFRTLEQMTERKTVVLVSAGLTSGNRSGGRVNLDPLMTRVFRDAAVANANVYVLHLDDSLAEATMARNSAVRMESAGADGNTRARGLEQIADRSQGSFLRVQGMSPAHAFDRVLRETTAYYLLAVATIPADRDGRVHFIRVKANVKGAEVKHRLQVVIPK